MPSTKCCYAKEEFSDRSMTWSLDHVLVWELHQVKREAVQFRTASPNVKVEFKIAPQEPWFAKTGFGEATDRMEIGRAHV